MFPAHPHYTFAYTRFLQHLQFHLIKRYTLWLSVSFQTLAYILNYSVLPMCPGTVGQSLLQRLWKGTRKKREHIICITADIFILLLLVSFAHFCSKFVLPRRRVPQFKKLAASSEGQTGSN